VRTVQCYNDGKKLGEKQTMHEALGEYRNPLANSRLICNGDVLAVYENGAWELRNSGISCLLEEFHSPLYLKERAK